MSVLVSSPDFCSAPSSHLLYLKGFMAGGGGGGGREVRLNPSTNIYIVTSRKNKKRSRHVALSPHLCKTHSVCCT